MKTTLWQFRISWPHHGMETFSVSLDLPDGNPSATSGIVIKARIVGQRWDMWDTLHWSTHLVGLHRYLLWPVLFCHQCRTVIDINYGFLIISSPILLRDATWWAYKYNVWPDTAFTKDTPAKVLHYGDVIMGAMASQIIRLVIVY